MDSLDIERLLALKSYEYKGLLALRLAGRSIFGSASKYSACLCPVVYRQRTNKFCIILDPCNLEYPPMLGGF
jgi:hypothetical protein